MSGQLDSDERVNSGSPFVNSRGSLEQGDAVTPVEASRPGRESVISSNKSGIMPGSSNGKDVSEPETNH